MTLSAQAPLVPAPDPAPPPSPGPSSTPPAPAQPAGTGIPLVDRFLGGLGGGQEPVVEGLPVLKPGDPRPVIGFKWDFADFLNSTYFKEETLRTFVKHPVGVPLDEGAANRDAEFIEQQYKLRGFLKARVKWTKEETPQGDFITFHLDSGSRGQLKQVEIVGNVGVSDENLIPGLFHRPLNALSLTDRAGVYHAGYIDQDIRAILKNYAEYGYLAATVKGARAYALDDGGGSFRLVFDAEDGPLYRVGLMKLTGDLPFEEERTLAVLGMKPGHAAALKNLKEGTERVLDQWRNAGYASAKADVQQRQRDDARELDVIIRFTRGPQTRIGKVKIAGSPTSADRVIKRDLAVREGQVYSLKAMKLSEERLLYTGLFQKVVLKPIPTDDPSIVDVEVEVTEQQSWYFSLAPAYIPGEGLVGIGFVGFRNMFGQAWRFNAAGVLSARRQTGQVDIEDPRVFNSRLGVSANGRWNRYVYPEFGLLRRGGSFTVAYPLIEHSSLALTYSLERVDMDSATRLEGYIGSLRFPTGKRRGTVRFDAIYDLRDNVLFPGKGLLLSASVEHGAPIWLGELEFVTLSANMRFYVPLPFGFVAKSNTAAAYVFHPRGLPVPAGERFYEGGTIQTIRGFNYQSISPTVTLGDPYDPSGELYGARIGGVSRFINNFELQSPVIPVTPLTPITLFVFGDAGNTWSEFERPFFFPHVLAAERDGIQLPLGLFYSVGVGGMLATALFPLRVEFSIPLTRRSQDQPINFFVTAGSPF